MPFKVFEISAETEYITIQVSTSEMCASFYQTRWCNIPEDKNKCPSNLQFTYIYTNFKHQVLKITDSQDANFKTHTFKHY
jgi:hypothetical protein